MVFRLLYLALVVITDEGQHEAHEDHDVSWVHPFSIIVIIVGIVAIVLPDVIRR